MSVGYRIVDYGAYCKRGHFIGMNEGPPPPNGTPPTFCQHCGARIVRACRTCNEPILGVVERPGLGTDVISQPDFCAKCATPFPWVDRAGRIAHLENLLDDEDLDEATELSVREQLAALADPDLDEDAAEQRWRRVRALAPGLWEKSGARAVATSLMTVALQRALGLDQ